MNESASKTHCILAEVYQVLCKKQFKSGDFGFYSEKQACVLKIHEDGEQSGTKTE